MSFSPFSVCMLFVCAVVTGLIPTITSSMPEISRFAIVEKYGDCATAVRRSTPEKMYRYGEAVRNAGFLAVVSDLKGLALALVGVHLPAALCQDLCGRGCQSFFNHPGPDLPARVNAELEHDVAHMRFDGSFANHKILGDLAVDFSLGNQICPLALPHCQPPKRLFVSALIYNRPH